MEVNILDPLYVDTLQLLDWGKERGQLRGVKRKEGKKYEMRQKRGMVWLNKRKRLKNTGQYEAACKASLLIKSVKCVRPKSRKTIQPKIMLPPSISQKNVRDPP